MKQHYLRKKESKEHKQVQSERNADLLDEGYPMNFPQISKLWKRTDYLSQHFQREHSAQKETWWQATELPSSHMDKRLNHMWNIKMHRTDLNFCFLVYIWAPSTSNSYCSLFIAHRVHFTRLHTISSRTYTCLPGLKCCTFSVTLFFSPSLKNVFCDFCYDWMFDLQCTEWCMLRVWP